MSAAYGPLLACLEKGLATDPGREQAQRSSQATGESTRPYRALSHAPASSLGVLGGVRRWLIAELEEAPLGGGLGSAACSARAGQGVPISAKSDALAPRMRGPRENGLRHRCGKGPRRLAPKAEVLVGACTPRLWGSHRAVAVQYPMPAASMLTKRQAVCALH